MSNDESTAAPDGETPSYITGDQASLLIHRLHRAALAKGYDRVRMDRGRHPLTRDYYEIGYVHGEVSIRFSHTPKLRFRWDTPRAEVEFSAALSANARQAKVAR